MGIHHEAERIARVHSTRLDIVARYEQAMFDGDIETVMDAHNHAESDPTLLAMLEALLIRQTDDMPAYDVQDALSRIHRMIEREEGQA